MGSQPNHTLVPYLHPSSMAAPTVVGINFGGSASSIAIISKEGLPDIIANDDGERQISNALSFAGEEEYVGIPAKSQLVRNNKNTVLNFGNLVGKSYDDVKSLKPQFDSAPIVSGPNDAPSYQVSVKDKETTLTAQDMTTKYLTTLIGFASDFLGRKIDSAVMSVPEAFSKQQRDALEKACEDAAGVKVLQFISEPAAAALAYGLTLPATSNTEEITRSTVSQDRNVVVLDVGATTTTSTLLAARSGLYVPLASTTTEKLGGESFDEQLISFISKEFLKKNKGLQLEPSNHRAMMKLKLSCEVTKRTLSASTTATCSIESLVDGVDYSGSINRSRFDLISAKVYKGIEENIKETLKKADVDPLQVQEVLLIGGTCKNPTLSERVSFIFPETTLITSQIEADEVIAKGAVLQALALTKLTEDEQKYVKIADNKTSITAEQSPVLSKPIGLLVPAPQTNGNSSSNPSVADGKVFVTVLEANTPLPARRIVELPFPSSAKSVKLSLSEGEESIHVQAGEKRAPSGDEDDEDEDEEDVRTKAIKPTSALAELVVKVSPGKSAKENLVKLTVIVTKDSKVEIEAGQVNAADADVQKLQL